MSCSDPVGKSVAFVTMGCAKNEADTARMKSLLKAGGYVVSDDPAEADVVIVNTCSFIQSATEESIEAILDAAELDNVASGASRLIVSGCMPARYGDELTDELPEVTSFVTCSDEEGIVGIVDELFGVERAFAPHEPIAADFGPHAITAYVKISDGCDRFCSYCTIPFIRGRYRSFSEEEIEAQVCGLIESGTREIVLIAQDTGRWGTDFEQPSSLAELLEHLAERHRDTWFRVMYIQPEGVTDDLIDVVARHANVCSYFDIPFQHCDPEILSLMNRKGSEQEHLDLIGKLRSRVPGVALRTTLIAGFPGETDEQFESLCSFVEKASLDYVGVFAYSREDGTRAATLDAQVDEEEKAYRTQRLRDTADAVSSSVIASRIGTGLEVLVFGVEEDGQVFGRAQCQAPDVDGVTYLDGGQPGECLHVAIEDTLLYEMEGVVVR